MNVTLSIDDDLLRRAREAAKRRGTSLNQMIRDLLADVTSDTDPEETVRELQKLWEDGQSGSKGRTWTREELYDRPVLR
jgi:hypothetical protein